MTETAYEEIGPLKGKHVVLDIDDKHDMNYQRHILYKKKDVRAAVVYLIEQLKSDDAAPKTYNENGITMVELTTVLHFIQKAFPDVIECDIYV